jgi:hypothetical protein
MLSGIDFEGVGPKFRSLRGGIRKQAKKPSGDRPGALRMAPRDAAPPATYIRKKRAAEAALLGDANRKNYCQRPFTQVSPGGFVEPLENARPCQKHGVSGTGTGTAGAATSGA